MADFFVPVALSNLEAIAVKSACMVVVTSAPHRSSPDHPLFSGALKIEEAYRLAKLKAETTNQKEA